MQSANPCSVALVLEAVQDRDGRKELPCAAAFRLVEEHGLTLELIGEICNERNIRIAACQLGCFH